jgi:two-component system, NarL family, nitrate/nitrite response regulator NarL
MAMADSRRSCGRCTTPLAWTPRRDTLTCTWERGVGQIKDWGPVLVVDDDPEFRGLARDVLRRVGCATVEAATAAEALAAAEREMPSLVLLKVELPKVSGYELCRELRDVYGEQLPIILVSADRVESIDRVAALLIGADDYLVKPIELEDDLLARVRRLLARPAATSGSTAEDASHGLTRREHEVLLLLAEGYTQTTIAERLVISPSTVGTHVQRILTKLGAHSRGQAVARAYRVGLLTAPVSRSGPPNRG